MQTSKAFHFSLSESEPPKAYQGAHTFTTPTDLKGGRLDTTDNRDGSSIEKIERIPLKEMKHAILLNVPGLIGKRFPDKLFQRLRHPRGDITVVDGSGLLHADSADVTPISITNDYKVVLDINKPQDDSGTSPVLDQQAQVSEAAEADSLQNVEDSEEPVAEDSHVSSMSKSPCVDPHSLSDLFHPSAPTSSTSSTESTVPVEEIFYHLSNNKSESLYDDNKKKWIDWPETGAQRKENEIAEYLNKILGCVRYFLYGAKDGADDWIFSSLFADRPIMGQGVFRKPDLALVHRKDSGCFEWEHIRAVAEIKTNAKSLKQIGIDSSKYIREMFGANKARRFALLFSLVDTKMALFKYDRSGVLVSKQFDIHENPKQFLRVIVGMAFGEDYYLGLDPSFLNKDGKTYVTFKGKLYEFIRVIHLDPVILSRGTVVILVKDPDTGELLVMKDQWVDRDRKIKEADILSKLAEKSLKVNRLVGYMVIAFKIGDADDLLDSTEADREEVEDRKKNAIEIRDHYRLLLSPFGDNITKFRSLRELVSSFRDYAETIRDLYKAGYYHRDISDKNLIIVPDDDNSSAETDSLHTKNDDSPTRTDSLSTENNESPTKADNTHRVGYLIDLDCATEVVHMRGAKAELTGTLPFMPIEMLENYGCEHKYYFDLEALFYVLDVDRVFRRYIEALEKARDGLPASDPMEDKPERRVRGALTTKRPTLVEGANDDDDSSVESEPDDKRKDPDYIDPGYISPTAGKGRRSRTTRSSLSTKRPGPDLGSSTKRRRTTSTRARSSRS
ncbi:hypothetical protein ACEPAI_3003 [Sanghuangporus weigelae]